MLGDLTKRITELKVKKDKFQREWDEMWNNIDNEPPFEKWTGHQVQLEYYEDMLCLMREELVCKGESIEFNPGDDEVERAKRLWQMALDLGWKVIDRDEYCGGEVLPRDLMHPNDARKSMDEFYAHGCGLSFYPKVKLMSYGTW